MQKSNQVYLEDMLQALLRIEEYSVGQTQDAQFADYMRLDAIVRQMEILGEAANHLSPDFLEKYPDFPAREATVMRNFLIHDYNNVEITTVWQTLLNDLPTLKKQIEQIVA